MMAEDGYGPGHWEALYRERRMPWDAGGVPPPLEEFLSAGVPAGRALVPGCGSGYEAARLAGAGMDVMAVDFSPEAVRLARRITRGSGAQVVEADFFRLAETDFDLIYERAFLCALPPRLRRRWATSCARLLAPGGLLAGLFFTDPDAVDGPPYGIAPDALARLLDPCFVLEDDRDSGGSLPVFAGRERWQVWRRAA